MKRCAMCGNEAREFGVVGAGGFREVCPRCIGVIQDRVRNLDEALPADVLLTSENALRFPGGNSEGGVKRVPLTARLLGTRTVVRWTRTGDWVLFSEREATRAFGPIWRTPAGRKHFFRLGRLTIRSVS